MPTGKTGGNIPMSTRPNPPSGPPPKIPSMHPHNNGYGDTRSLQRPRSGYNLSMAPERSTYSLPRTAHSQGQYQGGYYTHRPQSELQPDFYFMPSQRKYSGEVVRVYVDYNNKK